MRSIKLDIIRILVEERKIMFLYLLSVIIRVCIIMAHPLLWQIKNFLWEQLVLASLEPYLDYLYFYRKFAEAFISGRWLPYISDAEDPALTAYAYPPLFLYIISLPALISIDLVFIPLLLADILLPFLIYHFLKNAQGEEVAKWGFLATALCPLSVFYNGGLLFNTSLVTLVLVVSLYFLYHKRFNLAILALAVAFLFKQIVIFLFIPILLYAILKSSEDNSTIAVYLKYTFKYVGILALTIFIGSLPWILLSPSRYLSSIFRGRITLFPHFIPPPINWPVHWYDFLVVLGAPYWLIYILGFLTFTSSGIILVEMANVVLPVYWHQRKTLTWEKLLDLVVYTAILTHLFFPRGVYKYYFTLHVPLVILWLCFHFRATIVHQPKETLVKFLLFSLVILFLHRLIYLLVIWVFLFTMLRIESLKTIQSQECESNKNIGNTVTRNNEYYSNIAIINTHIFIMTIFFC